MVEDNETLYLKLPRTLMKVFGVWGSPKEYQILHYTYRFIVMLSQYSFLLFEFIYLLDVIDDIEAASEASYLLFTQASLCYKTTVFLMNKRNVMELVGQMEASVFAAQSVKHER